MKIKTLVTVLLTPALIDPLLCALLVALAFPPFDLWPLALLGWAWLIRPMLSGNSTLSGRSNGIRLAAHFATYSVAVNLFGFYWLSYTLREFGGIPWPLAVILMLLLFAVFGIFPGLVGYIWGRYSSRIPKNLRPLVLWIVLILFDGIDLRLFPWSPVMSVGGNDTLMTSVHFLGTWGWRFLFFGLATFLSIIPSFPLKKRIRWAIGVSATLLVFGIGYGFGAMEGNLLRRRYSERQPVALIQGNVGNYEKRLSKLQVMPTVENVLNIHRELIERAAIHFGDTASQGIEPWIAWPETSFPGYPLDNGNYQKIMENWARITRGLHLVGAYENALDTFAGAQTPLEFNIVALFHEQGGEVASYRKNIRLMFGEYIPGDEMFPWLYKILPAVNHFGHGREPKPLPHPDPNGPIFIPLVCYELLFEGFLDRFVEKAQKEYPGHLMVLVNPSNDSWYGSTSEPFQNAFLSRWAAARKGLPLLRPTNTGLSMVIAPWGEIMAQGPRNEADVIFGELPVDHVQNRTVRD